jgi:hypothetical protein
MGRNSPATKATDSKKFRITPAPLNDAAAANIDPWDFFVDT